MRRRRHLLAALAAAALACAAPAAALAQNAGDEQYADPFGKVQDKKKSSSGAQGSQGTQGSASQGGSQSGAQSSAGSSQTSVAPAQQTLPRTGAPIALFAATGAGLFTGGALLRRRASLD